MSIAGASYTANQDNSVSLRQTFIKQTFPADTVKRGIEKVSLRLQRVQNAATMSSNIVGLGSDNGVTEPTLTVWKAAGSGATHEIVIPVIVTAGSTITAVTRMNVGSGQTLGIPMRLTVEDPSVTDTFNGDATITSTTDGSTTFTATGTTTVDWTYIKLRIRINGAFTAQGDPSIITELGTLSLTVSQPLGNTTSIKVALFEDDKPIGVSDGKLAYTVSTSMTIYDFTFVDTPIVRPNAVLSIIVFIDGSVSGWTDANTTIKISIDATASPYALGYAEYYTSGEWSYDPTGIAGSYDETTTDIYFALFYTDTLPTNDEIENLDWTCDCDEQAAKIFALVTALGNWQTTITDMLNNVVQVEQNTPPVLEAFEREYGSSPIPNNKLLLWQNTFENEFGGGFIYNPTNDKLYENQNEFVRGYPAPIDFIQTSGGAFVAPAIGSGNFASWVSGAFVARFTLINPTMLTLKLQPHFIDAAASASILNFDYLIKSYGGTPVTSDLASVAVYGQAAGDGIFAMNIVNQGTNLPYDEYFIDLLHPTELAAGSYSIYINFWLRSGTANDWVLGFDPAGATGTLGVSNYPIILLEGITKWQTQ